LGTLIGWRVVLGDEIHAQIFDLANAIALLRRFFGGAHQIESGSEQVSGNAAFGQTSV